MASGKALPSGKASLAAVIVAVLALVLLVGWLAYANFLAPPKAPPLVKGSNYTFVEKVTKQAGGDYSKLSAEDQAKLESMTMGHGKAAFDDAWKRIKKAADKYGVEVSEKSWRELGKKPHTKNPHRADA